MQAIVQFRDDQYIVRKPDAGQVSFVGPVAGNACKLLAIPAPEPDVGAPAGELQGEGCPPGPGAENRDPLFGGYAY